MQNALSSSPLSQTVPLLTALREGTRDLHERLESRFDLIARISSLESYKILLERFYGLYATFEEHLASDERASLWSDLGLNFDTRKKTGLLESDLRDLGLSSTDLAGLSRCPAEFLPMPDSAAELAGCMYVLEGSTLGGQLIGKHVERSLGLKAGESGARFFDGYGYRTGAMWQQFRHCAERYVINEEAANTGNRDRITPRAIVAARKTFEGIEFWLTLRDEPNFRKVSL